MAEERPINESETTKRAARRRRLAIYGGACATVAVLAACILVFQDNIARFRLSPRTPFQIGSPPPAPDYGARAAWFLWPEEAPKDGGAAEVFYVHSTTYYSNDGWNAPFDDARASEELSRNAAPNEAGPFLVLGPVFAPRYRQATLFSFFTHKFDGVAARKLAYADVKAAFERFLASSNPRKPLVLVGYGQGGLHAQGLLKDYFQSNKDLHSRLAAAYVIDQATPLSLFSRELSATPPCASPSDIRCVISYTDYEQRFSGEIDRTRRRSMVWTSDGDLRATADDPLLCVNPLNWSVEGKHVDAERHLGAASATGLEFGSNPPAIARLIGAACENGVLVVDRPAQAFLRRPAWFSEKWRARSYNLFYHDLAADAARRVALAGAKMEEEYRRLDPIAESIDLQDSPINKPPH